MENLSLPKLNSIKNCPKCNFVINENTARYFHKSKHSNKLHNQCFPDEPLRPEIDCMERLCNNCSAHWFELDFDKSVKEESSLFT